MATTKIIQSLERASSILELFGYESDELSIREIADKSGLNKSTVFGLVNSLTYLGWLVQNPDNQKYSLGPKVLFLSDAAIRNNILIRTARPFLQSLADKYHETVHSAIEAAGAKIIYIDKVESDASVIINSRVGASNDMHCTGVGKCLLMYKSTAERDQVLSFPLPAKTVHTLTGRDRLYEELDRSRELGYAMDNEEIDIGLSCIAFPVFRQNGMPGFSISMSGATSRILDKINNQGVKEDMKKISGELSRLIYHYDVM